ENDPSPILGIFKLGCTSVTPFKFGDRGPDKVAAHQIFGAVVEMEEEQEEAERDPCDDDEFRDYFALAPPAIPDSIDDSIPPEDD
ncbi:hypothetical protein PIB30_098622, partial [Stylosanthes scabra]|nr:hypothetical protein [Stylosanthes scabra]